MAARETLGPCKTWFSDSLFKEIIRITYILHILLYPTRTFTCFFSRHTNPSNYFTVYFLRQQNYYALTV